MSNALYQSSITSLPLLGHGKVRDNYAVGDDKLLIVTTDRLSAFDVILGEPIPAKGRVLSQDGRLLVQEAGPSSCRTTRPASPPRAVVSPAEVEQVQGRAVVVKRLEARSWWKRWCAATWPGSGWKDTRLPAASAASNCPPACRTRKLPEPIFTPAAKAEMGEHDENISFAETEARIGADLARQMRDISIRLYKEAADYAATRGIIIADTKFEFGLDENGTLTLMDEVLTADSSRFWPADSYQVGTNPPSFDKQFVRDWLESVRIDGKPWPKTAPAPALPADVIEKTAAKYREALTRLTGEELQ
ncbi:phosphoribosylaminoimidazolesuccinocarboxamide synthase [Cupriavidus basilensis]